MTDLISRDDALRALNGACSTWEDDAKVQEIIMVLPSAEAVQGEWIRCEGGIKDFGGTTVGYSYWYECDQCGSKPPKDTWGHEWHSNFCPNCGARMKGGEQNDD